MIRLSYRFGQKGGKPVFSALPLSYRVAYSVFSIQSAGQESNLDTAIPLTIYQRTKFSPGQNFDKPYLFADLPLVYQPLRSPGYDLHVVLRVYVDNACLRTEFGQKSGKHFLSASYSILSTGATSYVFSNSKPFSNCQSSANRIRNFLLPNVLRTAASIPLAL